MKPIAQALALAGALTCLGALPARAELLSSSPSGFSMEQRIEVPSDIERTWEALTGEIDAWWPRDHTWWGAESRLSIRARAGGCFCERAGQRQAEHMRVVFVDPPATLRLVGGLGPLQGMGLHGALQFSLKALEGGGTEVRMGYVAGGYSTTDLSEFAPVVDRVQALQLDGLRQHLSETQIEEER
jgi:uncharacterized protein YndB with AHSA1/START domain